MPYGLNLGSLSNALRLTGGDPDLAERLLDEEEQQRRAPLRSQVLVDDTPAITRGLPANPYAEPAANPYQRGADDGVMRDFEPEVVRARPKEQRSIYDAPEIQAALERAGMAPRTYGGSAPNGQVPENPYVADPAETTRQPVQTQQSRTAALGSQDEANQLAAVQDARAQREQASYAQQAQIADAERQRAAAQQVQRAQGTVAQDPGDGSLIDRRYAPQPQQVQQALQRTQPAPVQLPPGTQQALQATGSQYQVPQVRGVDPRSTVKQLQGGIVDGYNDRIGLAQRNGEVQSDVDARQGKVLSDAADVSEGRNAAVDARGQEMIGRTDASRDDAYSHVEQMRKDVAERPGEQRPGLKIAGTILSFIPGLSGIGQGMYRLAQSKNREAQNEYSDRVKGHQTVIGADNAMSDQEHGDFRNEQAEQHVARLERDAVALNRAEAIAKAGSSEQARLKGANDALGLRDTMAKTLIDLKTAEQKKAGAGARSAEDTRITQLLSQVPDTERPDLAMKLGPRAVELLGKSAKNTTAVVGMGKDLAATEASIASAEKTRNEGTEGPKLSDGDKKLQRLADGVRPAYDTLSKYAAKIGKGKAEVPYIGIGPGATTMFAGEETQGLNGNIQQLANVLLRDESGANLPESEQKTKWDAWGITSPDAAVRNQGLGKMLAEYEGRVSHVAPVTGQPAQKPAATSGYSREEIEAELRRRRAQAGR